MNEAEMRELHHFETEQALTDIYEYILNPLFDGHNDDEKRFKILEMIPEDIKNEY